MDDGSPINPGGGSDTNSSGGGSNSEVYNVNYGTNLWIARFGIATNFTVGILSNSQPDVQYEILTTTNLLSQWTSAGFFSGSEITNWTQLFGIPFNPTNNLFLQARSWVDSDGIGIPDWWQLKYFVWQSRRGWLEQSAKIPKRLESEYFLPASRPAGCEG